MSGPNARAARPAVRLLALAALAAAAACTAPGTNPEHAASLRVGVAAPVLRAGTGSVGLTFHKAALTRETLVAIAADGRPAPRILESWQRGGDGLMWRMHVRPGVRFHDGTPLTAGELAPHVAAQLRAASLGAVKGVDAESRDVLRITLNEPYSFLFEDLSVISAQRAAGGRTFYTGAYAIASESPDRVLFKAVPGHYRGQPAIEQVDVRLYPDQRNAWGALMRDDIDMLYEVSRDALDFVRGESSVRVSTFPRPYVYLLGMNVRHPSLRDPRVRQALDRAVDRRALVAAGLAGEGEPAADHIWPSHWAYDPRASDAAQYDPRAAIRLLERAGLTVRREPGRMPARLRIHCLVYEPLIDLALVLQRQLAEIDVDLELELVPTGRLIEQVTADEFEAFVFEFASVRGFKFPYQFWHSSTPLLKHGYAGADDALDRVRRAASDAEFQLAASALQRRFHEDPPAVFLAWGRTSRAVARRYDVPETGDDIYHTIARWTPAARTAPGS